MIPLTSPVLKKDWSILLEHGAAYVERNSDKVRVASLFPAEAIALSLMDGRRSLDELNDLMSEAVGDEGNHLLKAITGRLRPLLGNGPPRDDRADVFSYKWAAEPKPLGIRRLPGPMVLHWHVTNVCPRRCAYCYANPVHGSAAADATIGRSRLSEIFSEAVSLGAQHLLASGAEPLLREDLPEILGDAVSARLHVSLTTKHPISPSLAHRLAESGMPHISLSLDSIEEAENQVLIGHGGYANQVKSSAANLKKAGIAFSIQCVVSRLAPEAARGVAEFAESSGATVLQLVPFSEISDPITAFHNEDLELSDESILDEMTDDLGKKHPRLRVEKFQDGTGGFHCDIGQTKMFFLPDGVIHRCYKLVRDSSLRGADLKHVSVAEAWHALNFLPIISPPVESYSGTPCSGCGKFQSCHTNGRCIYKAHVAHRKYSSPDKDCEGPFPTD